MKKNIAKLSILSVMLMPFLASAFNVQTNLIDPLEDLIQGIAPLMMTLVFIAFLWGLVKYVMSAGDPVKAAAGKSIMIWGGIALVVMASIWGITKAIQEGLDVDGNTAAPDPTQIIPGI